ncbi:unnamed protein product [Colias eurytheme]|nr:unnamed protein product [Colias eurytheme]
MGVIKRSAVFRAKNKTLPSIFSTQSTTINHSPQTIADDMLVNPQSGRYAKQSSLKKKSSDKSHNSSGDELPDCIRTTESITSFAICPRYSLLEYFFACSPLINSCYRGDI